MEAENSSLPKKGVFDLLSLFSYNEILEAEYDFLVLNSTAFVSKAMEIMKGYLQIDLYLDNDTNGKRTTETLMAHSNKNRLDKSMLYEGFKDMNEWLISYSKKGLGQEARDVSLLPQRQTRFTPDGRKVKGKNAKGPISSSDAPSTRKNCSGKKAERAGLCIVPNICRSSAFGNTVIERLTGEQSDLYKMLVKYKNNFTRIGNMFRKHNPKLASEVEQLAEEIRTHLYNFKRTEMIGKGTSIAHTGTSIDYGWNQEKDAEIVFSQHLAGNSPQEVTEEFRLIQEENTRCQKNTLSFILSPTQEDGRNLSKEQLGELTQRFVWEMQLKERQAIAFVHRDKAHTHVHLYVNRIGFDGKAYNDSFIGKRSQLAAEKVAREMGLTTVKEVQLEKEMDSIKVRVEIRTSIKESNGERQAKNIG